MFRLSTSNLAIICLVHLWRDEAAKGGDAPGYLAGIGIDSVIVTEAPRLVRLKATEESYGKLTTDVFV
jgi:hypothetical protein